VEVVDVEAHAPTARRGIFGIIAHEMADQWFGELVTMVCLSRHGVATTGHSG
jgi:Peptidase family M1 domain